MILLDLFLVGLSAVAAGWVCRRIGVPEVLGYLAAGMLLGPGLNAFSDRDTIKSIGQFAVVFRMFTLGLDFDARRLTGRWRPALTAGLLEMIGCTLAGLLLAIIFGWSPVEGAILGAALGTTSTSILSKALADRNMSARDDARAAGAATLTEDLIAMGMLGFLNVFGNVHDPSALVGSVVELLLFASLAFTAGAVLLPLILDKLSRSRSDELMTLAVIGVLFGFAALSFSIVRAYAVGAFLAGVAVGAARHAPGVGARVQPLRDLLTPVAYVSLGLFLSPTIILSVAPIAIVIALAFVAFKFVLMTIGLRLGGVGTVTAARAGAILGQAGTMGLVYACQPFLDPLGHFSTLLAIAFVAWAFTVALTPLRLRYLPDVAERLARAVGAKERPRRSERLHRGLAADTRSDAALLALATGCALAVAALAALVSKADDAVLPAVAGAPVDVALGVLVGLLVLPFALVAATAARRTFHRRARESSLGPRKLARSAGGASRGGAAASSAAVVLSLVLAGLAAPAFMVFALAPGAAWVPIFAGAAVGMLALAVRPNWLERATDECERLVLARHADASAQRPDARLHDFRGLSPFGHDVEALLVRGGTRAAWATLRDLAVPERTGARILAVVRPGMKDGAAVGPDTRLHPGDELVVGGSPAQIVAARGYLLAAAALEDDTDASAAASYRLRGGRALVDDAPADSREVDANVAQRGGGRPPAGPRVA